MLVLKFVSEATHTCKAKLYGCAAVVTCRTHALGSECDRCLGRLKTMEVVYCRRLKTVISYTLLCQVQNLEEIKVRDCRRMKCIIVRNVSDGLLRKLKVIEIRNLINLKTIWSRESVWPVLERIHVSNCPMLERLPLSAYDATTIREIKGDHRWWDNLRWEDDKTKLSLQERFQTCSYTEGLKHYQ